jgi:hypothetical protein
MVVASPQRTIRIGFASALCLIWIAKLHQEIGAVDRRSMALFFFFSSFLFLLYISALGPPEVPGSYIAILLLVPAAGATLASGDGIECIHICRFLGS